MNDVPSQIPALTRQLVIVHLSDLHFGNDHRFNPPRSVDGDEPDEKFFPSLLDKITEDLDRIDPGCPVAVCITGDFVETGDIEEFKKAESFIEGIVQTEIFKKRRTKDFFFIVPGNHDVKYDSSDLGVRWQQWAEFYNRFYKTVVGRESPHDFVYLHDKIDECGAVFLCLNSSIYVEKDKPDEERGRLDVEQLTYVEEALETINQEKLASAIRIALVHHHPVLIPALSEPGRGYDAIHNSGKLLTILKRHGFHLILHGHKHNPHTFTDDTKSAHQDMPDQPIFIVSGGSTGSCGLPQSPRCGNCYNIITIKWHPDARQARIRCETRSLRLFNPDGTEKLPTRWTWESLSVDDRHFYGINHIPNPGVYDERIFDTDLDGNWEQQRTDMYRRTRGNLPIVQVLPSLVPDQAYEIVLWIVPHPYGGPKPENDIPTEVTWSAGEKFEVVTIRREDDPNYTVRQSYWAPMLVQARMRFPDGYETAAHVYARMPCVYHAEQS